MKEGGRWLSRRKKLPQDEEGGMKGRSGLQSLYFDQQGRKPENFYRTTDGT